MGRRRATSDNNYGTVGTYLTGFILSLLLTLEAYILVAYHILSDQLLIVAVTTAAVVQLVVQLVFFLHLGSESKPRWKVLAFLFALMVLLIVVFGSLWIMNNLNYHIMSPSETDTRLIHDEGIKR